MKKITEEDKVRAQVRYFSKDLFAARVLALSIVNTDKSIDPFLTELLVDVLAGAISNSLTRKLSHILDIVNQATPVELDEFKKIGQNGEVKEYDKEKPGVDIKAFLVALLTKVDETEKLEATRKHRLAMLDVVARNKEAYSSVNAKSIASKFVLDDAQTDPLLVEMIVDILSAVIETKKVTKLDKLISTITHAKKYKFNQFKRYSESTYIADRSDGEIKCAILAMLYRISHNVKQLEDWRAELDQCHDTHLESTITKLNELYEKGRVMKLVKDHPDFHFLSGYLAAVEQAQENVVTDQLVINC